MMFFCSNFNEPLRLSLHYLFRELVEQGAEELLSAGAEGEVALLVVGDPFGATTHTDLVLRKCLVQYKFIQFCHR
jgi:diphthamide biosynthesis methyltransferase